MKSTNTKTMQEMQEEIIELLYLLKFWNIRTNEIDYQIKARYTIEGQKLNPTFYIDFYYNTIAKKYIFEVEPDNLEKYQGFSIPMEKYDIEKIEQELYNNYDFIKRRQLNIFDFI